MHRLQKSLLSLELQELAFDTLCKSIKKIKISCLKQNWKNKIATYTAGRAAEKLFSTPLQPVPLMTLSKPQKLARSMITRYGMNERFGMVALETVNSKYLGGDSSLACSQDTAATIDQLVVDLVQTQYAKS